MSEKSSYQTTAENLARYDRPGPRYTSYPTAVEFHDQFKATDYADALARADALGDAPLSIYAHIPFCEHRCHFCGCHVIISPRKEVAEPYLQRLLIEIDMVAARLPNRRKVAQFHIGGGTPTYLSPDQLALLMDKVGSHFTLLPDAELAVEVDPRVTTNEHVDALRRYGFNRISMGVQDFTLEVQEAVARVQTREQTVGLAEYARAQGFTGLNIDLIYGLPYQRIETFADTLDQTIEMRPDRVAVYSFAFVPWMKGNQKRLPDESFPSRDEKFALCALAREKFIAAGYQAIGMDHFALPDDELSVAQREGRLYRNFMGYTVMPGADALGLGISAIGDVRDSFVQNEKKLSTYYAAIDAGELPVHKGYVRSADDNVRREVIQDLMCNFRVDIPSVESRHGIDFRSYFEPDLQRLQEWAAEGLVEVRDAELVVTEAGQLFVRNLAMCFDAYLKRHQESGKPVFSRTV